MTVEKPEPRTDGHVSTYVLRSKNLAIYATRSQDEIIVFDPSSAEMLIHALAEWIDYKRQLELWESAERDRENEL